MIAVVSPLFPPANKGGGPIKSVSGVCAIFDKEQLPYKVLTNDKDLDGRLLPESEHWPKINYLKRKTIGNYIKHLKGDNDLVWLNTLYNIKFAFIPIVALLFVKKTKVLITPRGQLLFGTVTNFKKVYLKLLVLLLRMSKHDVIIHYTHEDEKEKSYGCFKKFDSVIFPNTLSGDIEDYEKSVSGPDKFVIAFFGRINKKKNISFILELLPELDASVVFEIHGAAEDLEYKEKCNTIVEKYNLQDRVSYHGYYDRDSFVEKSKQIDLIVVPSLSENFCHVFFEAIEVSKIVVASSGLPWEDANDKVRGTILPLDKDQWVARIKEVSRLSESEYKIQQNLLKEYYKSIHFSIQKQTIHNFKKLINT